METYLDRAREGEHGWKTYLWGAILILFFWQVAGGGLLIGLAILLRAPGMSVGEGLRTLTDLSRFGPIRGAFVLLLSELMGFLGLSLTLRNLHRRPLTSLITYRAAIQWTRVLLGFGVWLTADCLEILVGYATSPSHYSISFAPATFLPFLPIAIAFIAVQTSLEELIFRGYLLQGASLIRRSTAFLVIISGLAFALPHLINPEAEHQALLAGLDYFLTGALLAWWSIRDGTIELALGIHAANNTFGLLVVGYRRSVLNTPSIFYYNGKFDAKTDVIANAACILVFSILIIVLRRWVRYGRAHAESAH
jgi:hypothetical protein